MDVLLVEADEDERIRLSDALERRRWRVVACPGPLGPDYSCVGGRTGACPLIDPADVVVLDLWLPGDDLLMGTSAVELLGVYVGSGTPVVALGRSAFAGDLYAEERLTFLPRHPDTAELIQALEDATVSPRGTTADPTPQEER
ncbi:MAG: response regulator transcription factor [Actinobacteria bacterium]|nr:response regulator transcription factor [Actinomycetota bacterium]